MYWVKTPWVLKKLFKNYTWDKSSEEKKVYLTFDDGPIPIVTEWVVDILNKNGIKATFFCVGDNLQKHPEIANQLILANHKIGNHTFNHNKGWETTDEVYMESIQKTQMVIDDLCQSQIKRIFRPPYGKITPTQSDNVRNAGYEVVMWDVLSADFDPEISVKKCLRNVIGNTVNGSIVVFHDNVKSFKTLQYVLPRYIKYLQKKGFQFGTIY